MRKDIQEKIPQILEWIEEKRSKNWMCKNLNCRPRTLDQHLEKNNIIYKGNMGGKGHKTSNNKIPDDIWLSIWLKKGTTVASGKIRNRLFSSGMKSKECEECGGTTWMNREIPLDLHHINGDRFDNRFENLQILCKNCHGITENYSIPISRRKFF